MKATFKPKLSTGAHSLLLAHYLECRRLSQASEYGDVINIRFLQSLLRLSQAHARLMYRDVVELDDAVAVVLLMESTAHASGGFRECGGPNRLKMDCIHEDLGEEDDEVQEFFNAKKMQLLEKHNLDSDGMQKQEDDGFVNFDFHADFTGLENATFPTQTPASLATQNAAALSTLNSHVSLQGSEKENEEKTKEKNEKKKRKKKKKKKRKNED